MADDNKCGHAGCDCPAAVDSKYCTAACQEANSNDATDEPCSCGCETCSGA